MHSRLSFLLSTLLIAAAAPSVSLSQATAPGRSLTLQVGSFPNSTLADRLIAELALAGEQPKYATVQLPGRGAWTRVFVGAFFSSDEARRYGNHLVAERLIKEFLVKRAEANQEATRPRRVVPDGSRVVERSSNGFVNAPRAATLSLSREESPPGFRGTSGAKGATPDKPRPSGARSTENKPLFPSLPIMKARSLEIAPCVDIDSIPRPDPVSLALRLLIGGEGGFGSAQMRRGGLWLTGDKSEGLARLRWIAGDENAGLIRLYDDGRVELDRNLLAKLSGLAGARVEDPVAVANYILSNEGLLLIVQLTHAHYRYRLHVDGYAPTHGKSIEISSSVNLDRNYDSRINPHRRHSKKLDHELPPEGFDSLVALNPVARWYNLSTNSWVPAGEVTFHELAEAYAKLELGLDYLAQGALPGAHALALEREHQLKAQRPGEGIVMTAGSNRVLRNEEEIRMFLGTNPGSVTQR